MIRSWSAYLGPLTSLAIAIVHLFDIYFLSNAMVKWKQSYPPMEIGHLISLLLDIVPFLSLPLYLIRHFLSFVRSLISLILEKNVYNVSSIYTSHWTYNMAYCDRTHKWLYPKYIFELTSAPYIYVYINGWTANGIERWRHPDTINWISWDGIRQPSRHYWRNKGFRSKLMDKCHQVLDHQVINQIKLKQKQNKKSCMYPCR